MLKATSLLRLTGVLAALLATACAARAQSTLAVRDHVFWHSERPPTLWPGPDPAVLDAIDWSTPRSGLQVGLLPLAVNRGMLRLQVIVVRAELGRFDVALEERTARGRADWSIERRPRTPCSP